MLFCEASARGTMDPTGREWETPVEQPNFHQWVGSCNNPELLALDDTTALLFYSDFYYPDADGVKRKTILCRKLRVLD